MSHQVHLYSHTNSTHFFRTFIGAMCFTIQILVLLLGCGSVSSKKCFDCTDLPHPRDCRKVVECPQSDVCFVDQFVTGGGLTLYNTGCRSTQRCQQNRRRKSIGSRSDILLCSECCSGEYCNLVGCGQTAPAPSTRGPYCFACDSQSSETSCRNIRLCDTDQVCQLTYSEIDHFYTTRCTLMSQCHGTHAQLIGRRTEPRQAACHTCCASDFCNSNCTTGSAILIRINGQWSVWEHWGSCTTTCGHGQRSRSRSCDNPAPQNGGTSCSGHSTEKANCIGNTVCQLFAPIDGGFSSWGQWSVCKCGQAHRVRLCDSPAPAHEGKDCVGPSIETRNCTHNTSCSITQDSCKRYPGYEWHALRDATHEYHACLRLYPASHVWTGARHLCHVDHAEMFAPYNRGRQLLMKSYLASKKETELVWLGAQKNTTGHHMWFWNGPRQHRMTFTHFLHASDITSGHGECAVVMPATANDYWTVKNCWTKHRVLCELMYV